MISIRIISRWHFALALAAALSAQVSAQSPVQDRPTRVSGQSPSQLPSHLSATPDKARSSGSKQDIGEQSAPDQVEELTRKVEQLQALVEQQQLSLVEMQKQMTEIKKQAWYVSASLTQPDTAAASGESGASLEKPGTHANSLASGDPQSVSQNAVPIVAGWDGNHAFLRSTDGNFETFVTGYSQLDFRGYSMGSHPASTFVLRRARLALEGKLFRYFDYKVEGDFADTAGTLLRDAYLRVHRIDQLQATFGHFKEPFSQEELRGDPVQDFVERSLVNNLAPSRSPGLMASGVLKKGVFEYQLGAFNGKGLLSPNNTGTPESVLRIRVAPWKRSDAFWLNGLAFGGASAYGRSSGGTSVRGQTESHSISFFTPDAVNGKIIRANGELTWMLGPASIRAEYDHTNQERHGLGPKGNNLPGVIAKGYMGQFTYLLTGENKPDTGAVNPRHNLFGESGDRGFGAWELKFRYANLQISDGTSKSNRAETFYFGPNWYLNRFVRYVLDLGFERFKDPLRTPLPGDKNFFVVLSRIQVAF